jgi:hypothetical protein
VVEGAKLFHLEGVAASHLLIPHHFSLFPEATDNTQLPNSKLQIKLKLKSQKSKLDN